jgi:hypothetical protein
MLCNIGGGLLSVLENQLNFILIGLEEKVNAKTKTVIIFRKSRRTLWYFCKKVL